MSHTIDTAMFTAPWWAIPINPFFLARRALWQAMSEAAPLARGRLLDVGCGNKPYRSLFTQVEEYLGLELDTPRNRQSKQADLFYDGGIFPIVDNSFDALLCNQVLEHIFRPEHFLLEIHRVLRPGGVLILTVPLLWPEHEQPHDCLRYTSFGLRDRLERAGLKIEHQARLNPGGAALCALAADHINSTLRPTPLPVRLLGRVLLIAPLSLLGWLLTARASAEAELYLDNFVICRKPV
ncbi:Class I SAM-dependent methyltransferase [Gammaproteobacteria bacterium]